MEEKKENWLDKAKKLADKAEDLIEDQVEKLKKSKVVDKVEDLVEKAGDFVEDKIDDFKKSDIPGKIDDFSEKVEKKASGVIKKAGEIGDKVSEKIEEFGEKLIKKPAKKDTGNSEEGLEKSPDQ